MINREQIVAEALSWVGTPYHPRAMVKLAGCDCATFILGVFRNCGLVLERGHAEAGDWFCHTQEDRYFAKALRHGRLVAEGIGYASLAAQPGDIVLTHHQRSVRVYNHGGIVVKWPSIVHSVYPRVELADATKHWMWGFHQTAVLDPYEVPVA